jgi:hypothetical protein
MAIYTFRKGERVTSKVAGYYMGQPGTIIGESQIQYNLDKRYIIELDIGKRITLPASRIRLIDESYKGLLGGLNFNTED